MKVRKLRRRFALASTLGAGAMAAALILSAGVASASTVPAYPGTAGAPVAGFGLYPNWLPLNTSTGAEPTNQVDNSEGSDTTLFVMQSISDLYSQAGINPFSCTDNTSPNGTCETPTQNSGVNPNNSQSDETDNFAGSEELVGINDVGSGNGLSELCSAGNPVNAPSGTTVDYARASRPDTADVCPGDVGLGFAKDAVVALDFQSIIPSLYGAATGYETQTDPQCTTAGEYPSYAASNGAVTCTAFPDSGLIGPVADGWLPTDPTNCGTGGGPACSGTPFTDIDNTPISGGTGATSVAYRLFCQHGPSTTPNESQITDWGQLTNLGGNPLGDGTPIGVPIRIIGINSGSGTVSTFYNFAQSGIGSPSVSADCGGGDGTVSSHDVDVNAASGKDPDANQGPAGSSFTANPEISLENDANQIGDFANNNWPGDAADQAVDIATSLYSMSYGAYVSNPNAEVTSIETAVPSGDPSTFTEKILTENTKKVSIANERSNAFPTSRTLFNYYLPTTIRASAAGFLNWMCDSNSAIQKGTDHIDGGNFDTDLTNLINGEYGYSRLTDTTSELPAASQTPADNVPGGGVNGSCDANLAISSISSDGTTITLTNPAPTGFAGTANAGDQVIQPGWTVNLPSGDSWALPSGGDSVKSVSGSTIVLNSALVAGTGTTTPTIYFPGQAPVMSVGNVGS